MATVLEESAKEGQIKSRVPENDPRYIIGRSQVSMEEFKRAYDQNPKELRKLREGWLALNQIGIIFPFPRNVSEYTI